ncbi:MAG: AAA family ATPase, partial [Nocardioidaceae bacterium]
VLRLLGDADFLATAAEGVLTPAEQALITWTKPPRGPGSARWSVHDAVLVDEAADLLGRTPSLGHVVLDEAQDLSPMMLRAVGRHCSTGSVTVLGDLAQATTPWGVDGWSEALTHLDKPAAHLEELTLGFRVPADVIEYAARLLPAIAPTLTPPTSVRRGHGGLQVTPARKPFAAATEIISRLADQPGSIGLIVADAQTRRAQATLTAAGIDHSTLGARMSNAPNDAGADPDDDWVAARVDVVPASLAKGLEFDHVVLVEPADVVDAEPDERTGLRRLYVCLTRAVTSLEVVHALPIPAVTSAGVLLQGSVDTKS